MHQLGMLLRSVYVLCLVASAFAGTGPPFVTIVQKITIRGGAIIDGKAYPYDSSNATVFKKIAQCGKPPFDIVSVKSHIDLTKR